MPEDSRLCKVTHQDGTASYGYWLGNDPVAPIDCWMLDISEEFCGRKNGEKIQELGPVASWQYVAQPANN